MAAFHPANAFATYEKDHLLKLARFYPMDLSNADLVSLSSQLNLFIRDMSRDLSIMLVKTENDIPYSFVYKLL